VAGVVGHRRGALVGQTPEDAADWGLTSFDPSHPSSRLEIMETACSAR
jgi:hypothetical protein